MTLPINTIVAKEFDLRGAFRFHEEFGVAVSVTVGKAIAAYEREGARLLATARAVLLVEEALRGRRFVARL